MQVFFLLFCVLPKLETPSGLEVAGSHLLTGTVNEKLLKNYKSDGNHRIVQNLMLIREMLHSNLGISTLATIFMERL